MDIDKEASRLLEAHGQKTQRLSPLLRATARTHYHAGVTDCLEAMKRAALLDEREQRTAPSAVQPGHSAVEELNDLQK